MYLFVYLLVIVVDRDDVKICLRKILYIPNKIPNLGYQITCPQKIGQEKQNLKNWTNHKMANHLRSQFWDIYLG